MNATLSLEIPGDALEAAHMTADEAKLELAIALFARERLSMGKAAELSGLSVAEFQMHLGGRKISPHYSVADALADHVQLSGPRIS